MGLALVACESEAVPVIHLSVGANPEDHRSFQPRSSLAEYVEIPGFGAELRVVLSSHPITCESYTPLAEDQILATLNFTLPIPNAMLGAGIYPWPGGSPPAEPPPGTGPSGNTPSSNTPSGNTPSGNTPSGNTPPGNTPSGNTPSGNSTIRTESEAAQVMPHIRFGKLGREMPPGGFVELTEVRLEAQGSVRGLLRLEQPGSAGLPATSLQGSFSARWCRISLASGSDSP